MKHEDDMTTSAGKDSALSRPLASKDARPRVGASSEPDLVRSQVDRSWIPLADPADKLGHPSSVDGGAPGEELDVWIAEHCLGWRFVPRGTMMLGGWVALNSHWRDEKGNSRLCPGFSTGISDAWSVVERMRELGWHATVNAASTTERPAAHWTDDWHTCFSKTDDDEPHYQAFAATAPLAICLAAKATLEAKL